jgi:hypothetical protein
MAQPGGIFYDLLCTKVLQILCFFQYALLSRLIRSKKVEKKTRKEEGLSRLDFFIIKQWSEAESLTIFENYVYPLYQGYICGNWCEKMHF